ncbi:MAG: hypothetical protein P9G45_08620 [Candidatus Contendobacter sp.]|nr:hypothetical protein [Candidatus Contendobacter sp.]
MLGEPEAVALLREAFATVNQRHPFRIDAVGIPPARRRASMRAFRRQGRQPGSEIGGDLEVQNRLGQ